MINKKQSLLLLFQHQSSLADDPNKTTEKEINPSKSKL